MSLAHLFSLAVSWALFGLIWLVQLVHYPSFRYIGDFQAFHGHHTSSISLIVGPLMLAELAISVYLAWSSSFQWQWLLPLLMVLLIWANTFFQAVPLHEKLAQQAVVGADSTAMQEQIEALIRVNWPRTILWTLKALWLSWLACQLLKK
ncbi:MAG: hypothetical protein AAF433_17740 [Bacteroidota bacterium]